MKKILITGAAGTVGINTIKTLLTEDKYEITALDLNNKKNNKILKKYQKRINIVFGDINNETLIEALIKDHDIIIHLAGSMPPLCNIKKELTELVDYQGTKNIIDAINLYNSNAYLIYPSSTTLYGVNTKESKSIKDEIILSDNDHYSSTKIDIEQLIKDNVKNYTIYRLPIVLVQETNQDIIYHIKKNKDLEVIKANDVAFAITATIEKKSKLNNKIYNLTGGKLYQTNTTKYLIKHLEVFGLSWKYIFSQSLLDRNYHTHYYTDGDKLASQIKYITGDLKEHYKNLKNKTKYKRIIRKLLAKPIIFFLKRKIK